MNDVRQPIEALFAQIPGAIWSRGSPLPYCYRGSPLEMVEQMAEEMGPGVTATEAMDHLMEALAKEGRLRLSIEGDPPENIRAGIFVYTLLQHGVFHAMAQA